MSTINISAFQAYFSEPEKVMDVNFLYGFEATTIICQSLVLVLITAEYTKLFVHSHNKKSVAFRSGLLGSHGRSLPHQIQ